MRISDWSSDVCSSGLLRFRGKGPATDVRRILRRGGGYRVSNGLVTFNEPRHAPKHAQHIPGHQHLAIATRRRANPNGRTTHRLRYLAGDLSHHTPEYKPATNHGLAGTAHTTKTSNGRELTRKNI